MKSIHINKVTVAIPTFNRADCIADCIDSLLKQTYTNIEIIICDDKSTDNTVEVIKSYKDKRITLLENKTNMGDSTSRNNAIQHSTSEIIFFTDDDVIVPHNWIETGLKYFNRRNVVGVEGKIIYINEKYKPSYSDRVVENKNGGHYMTANVAYRKSALSLVGNFNELYRRKGDREISFRLKKIGKIVFAKDFYVTHRKDTYTVSSYFKEIKKIPWLIKIHFEWGDESHFTWKVYDIKDLIVLLFPLLVFIKLFQTRFISYKDWKLFLLIYPRLIYERFTVWKTAFKTRKLII